MNRKENQRKEKKIIGSYGDHSVSMHGARNESSRSCGIAGVWAASGCGVRAQLLPPLQIFHTQERRQNGSKVDWQPRRVHVANVACFTPCNGIIVRRLKLNTFLRANHFATVCPSHSHNSVLEWRCDDRPNRSGIAAGLG